MESNKVNMRLKIIEIVLSRYNISINDAIELARKCEAYIIEGEDIVDLKKKSTKSKVLSQQESKT
jgi:hypothetical protein